MYSANACVAPPYVNLPLNLRSLHASLRCAVCFADSFCETVVCFLLLGRVLQNTFESQFTSLYFMLFRMFLFPSYFGMFSKQIFTQNLTGEHTSIPLLSQHVHSRCGWVGPNFFRGNQNTHPVFSHPVSSGSVRPFSSLICRLCW